MDEKPITTDEQRYNDKDTGKFKPGNPGRPDGCKNKFSLIKLEEAIEAEEKLAMKENEPGIFQKFVRMAYINPAVMIALMKKFVPDMQHTEITGTEPLKFEVEILNGNKKPESK